MSVEKLLDYLEPKTFGKVHYVVVVFLDRNWCHLPCYIRRHGKQRTQA